MFLLLLHPSHCCSPPPSSFSLYSHHPSIIPPALPPSSLRASFLTPTWLPSIHPSLHPARPAPPSATEHRFLAAVTVSRSFRVTFFFFFYDCLFPAFRQQTSPKHLQTQLPRCRREKKQNIFPQIIFRLYKCLAPISWHLRFVFFCFCFFFNDCKSGSLCDAEAGVWRQFSRWIYEFSDLKI